MTSKDIYIVTQNQRNVFEPTYLMIKQHEVTGLKYLCKTIKKDPIKYNGSGKRWTNHIKKHGKEHVKTIWYKLFTDIDELVGTAIALSEMYDVVDSPFWANLKEENGLSGGICSTILKRIENGTHHLLDGSIQRKSNKKRIDDGTHHLLGNSNPSHTRVKNGTHNFQGPESNKKRIDDGTHNFMNPDFIKQNAIRNSELNKIKVSNGTHHFCGDTNPGKVKVLDGTHHLLGGAIQRNKSNRKIYKQIKTLLKINNIPIPRGLYMRSDEYLATMIKNMNKGE